MFTETFSHFCFQSYLDEKYEFTEDEIYSYLRHSMKRFGLSNASVESLLWDLRFIVCMLLKDGHVYRFSHRSFQAYFAACYTSELEDRVQQDLLAQIIKDDKYISKTDYYNLLFQIERDRFLSNALEQSLREILILSENVKNPDVMLFRQICDGFGYMSHSTSIKKYAVYPLLSYSYICNIVVLFSRYVLSDDIESKYRDMGKTYSFGNLIGRYLEKVVRVGMGDTLVGMDEIEESPLITEVERECLYSSAANYMRMLDIRIQIGKWIAGLDSMRVSVKKKDFYKYL